MGDEGQQDGWWVASDGKSYPPEKHPDYKPPASTLPPAPGFPPPTGAPGAPGGYGPPTGAPAAPGSGFGSPPGGPSAPGAPGGGFGSPPPAPGAQGAPGGGYGSPTPTPGAPGGGFGSPGGGYGVPPMGPPPAPKTNTMAVISFVASLLGFCFWGIGALVAVVLGHIGLSQIKKSGNTQSGRGFAIAGLCIGYLQLLAGIALVVIVVVAGDDIADSATDAACGIENRVVAAAAEAATAQGESPQSVEDLASLGYLDDDSMLGTYRVSGPDVTQIECPAG